MQLLNVAIVSFALLSQLAAADSPVVATVGSKQITLEDFNRRYDKVKEKAVNPPPKKVFLEDLIRYEVGLQEAQKRGLEKDPVIAERMREELYKGLIEKDLSEKINAITVSADEMKDYYKTNPELKTSHILIEVKPGANAQERAAAKKRAEDIYAEVKKSKQPFEKLVSLYTDDLATKKLGGDVGFQSRLTVVPSYYDAAIKLKVGAFSDVVETPYGFHIIKLTGKHLYTEADKRQLTGAVFERKRLVIFNDYFDKAKKRYKITVDAEALNK